jgi:hypothetical protein
VFPAASASLEMMTPRSEEYQAKVASILPNATDAGGGITRLCAPRSDATSGSLLRCCVRTIRCSTKSHSARAGEDGGKGWDVCTGGLSGKGKADTPDLGGNVSDFVRYAREYEERKISAKRDKQAKEVFVSSVVLAGGAFVISHLNGLLGAAAAVAGAATLLDPRTRKQRGEAPHMEQHLAMRSPGFTSKIVMLPVELRRKLKWYGKMSLRAFMRAKTAVGKAAFGVVVHSGDRVKPSLLRTAGSGGRALLAERQWCDGGHGWAA